MFLYSQSNYTQADLVLPDGAKIHYVRTSAGTGFTDAVYVHQETQTTSATPTIFYKSVLSWNGQGWNLTLKEGTVYVFGDVAPLQAIRDRYGNQITVTHANGQTGNITQVTSPSGRWIRFSYDASNRITQAQDHIGRTVIYTYDANGNLATVTDPLNHVTSYTYDSAHQMLTVKPPSLQGTQTNLVTNEYTTAADAPTPIGWVKKQTHADGGIFQFAYTFVNGAISRTDVTDPLGNVRRVTFNANAYTLTDTRAYGQGIAQTDSNVRETGSNFITSYTNTHGDVTATTYDSKGNVLTVTQLPNTPDQAVTTYTYEPVFNQVTSITDPLNHTTTLGYDNLGNCTSVTDALNHKTTYTFNGAGQVTSVTDPLQNMTSFTYVGSDLSTSRDPLNRVIQQFVDTAGRVIAQTDPAGQTTRFAYDALNHLTQVTDPLGGVTAYAFDTAGRLGSVTDTLTHATTYGYDTLDRLASRTDPLSKVETFSYDVSGNPSQSIDRKGQMTTRTYDGLNRLSQITYDDGSTVAYGYDPGNRLTTITDSVNGTITRTYDNRDRLTSETTPQGSVSYTYDLADRRATMTVAGQPVVTYGYDPANRLTSVTQGTSTVTLTYDDADRRASLTLPNGIVTAYGYDNADQLTSLTYSLGATTLGTLTYVYDLAGRRVQVGGTWARTGLSEAVASTSYDAANRLTAWSGNNLSYDANGNLASDGLTSYAWNARDQLNGLSGGGIANFAYDGVGRRRSKAFGGGTTAFLYDGNNVIQEISGSTVTANLLAGLVIDETFMRTDATGTSAFLVDAIGSTRALSDGAGAIQTQYMFEPFGMTTASGTTSSNAMQFTGREDDGTGLYYFRARYYSPGIGRFISSDPIGILGGLNTYAYGSNNPVTLMDPTGLAPLPYDRIVELVKHHNHSGLTDELVICLIWKESTFDPSTQRKGARARGLMQLQPRAATDVGADYSELTDPVANIAAGTFYLKLEIHRSGGDVTEGLNRYGTRAPYANNILDCEKCLKQRNETARQKDPICSDPKKCLEKIHR
jgi:RHS repeat-associated protein